MCNIRKIKTMEPRARLLLRYVSIFVSLAALFKTAFAVTHYTIPEEMDEGSVVANLVSDLGLDLKSISKRKYGWMLSLIKNILTLTKILGSCIF